jgi:hypothetical protein
MKDDVRRSAPAGVWVRSFDLHKNGPAHDNLAPLTREASGAGMGRNGQRRDLEDVAMARWFGINRGVVVAIGLGAALGPAAAPAQVVRERDTTITGPRGRSVQRSLESVRGPGFLERETTIRRPGGTFKSDVLIQRPGPGGFIPRGGPPLPRWRGGFGPREVIINNGVGFGNGLLDFGIGAVAGTGLGMLLGRATAPTAIVAPPVVAASPVVVAPGAPMVVQAPPQVVQAPPTVVHAPLAQVVPPEVAVALQRLQSNHDNSRRDGCLTLGRLGDDRAVAALVDRLKNDRSKDVRVAAATALGQIGDPNASVYLERATVYDKKQDVRDAAASALARMSRPAAAPASAGIPTLEPADAAGVPQALPLERVPPPPAPANPRR